MNRPYLHISLLYLIPLFISVYIAAEKTILIEPITIDFSGLRALDNSGMINIPEIVQYKNKLERTIKHKINELVLSDYVSLESDGNILPETVTHLIDAYKRRFRQISQEYFNKIGHLKPVLVKLISSWAHQRNRADSLVLLWASIEQGKEEAFIAEYVPTLKVFYTFLCDVDMLLNDIINSCPKTYAHYLECKKLIEEKHQQHA